MSKRDFDIFSLRPVYYGSYFLGIDFYGCFALAIASIIVMVFAENKILTPKQIEQTKDLTIDANDIYEKLMNVSDEDIDSLIRIRKEASESLGISFIDHHIYNELLSKTNPKRFMNPYDPEKVRIANTLYTKLSNGGLDIDEIEEIQKEILCKT